MMHRFSAALVAIALWCASWASTSAADTYPTKPIVILSWSSAGSPVDVMAREIAKLGPKYLGQQMVVEDKTGADGGNSLSYLLAQPADGYTILALTNTLMVSLNTSLKDRFTPDQFAFVGTVVTDPYVIAVRSESPLRTFADLKAKSGSLTIGGAFAQSAESFFARDMGRTTGIKFNWVPYDGGSSSVAAGLGGHVDAVCTNISGVSAFVKSGQMRVLAVSTPQAVAILPGTPTFASLGYKSLTSSHWRGMMAKKGLPPAVDAKLQTFLKQVADDPEFKQYVQNSGLIPFYNDHAALDRIVSNEMAAIGKMIAQGIGT